MASESARVPVAAAASLLVPQRGRVTFREGATRGAESQRGLSSLAEKYSLPPSPKTWGTPLYMSIREPDDFLHNPDPRRDRVNEGKVIFTVRGAANLGCLVVLSVAVLLLFAGYPIATHFTGQRQTTQGGFNLGGINATGQVASMPGNWGLIDLDTPKSAYKKKSYTNPREELELVFSDEFNTDGRSFYPGDDPYWEAVDLWYWATENLEWLDPSAVTTKDGALRITLSEVDPASNHNMSYRSGMIQSWNKFCFTGGLIETSVTLPGANNVHGLWPAIWTMGNLEQLDIEKWPYSYDLCDVGTLPNQTYTGTRTPQAALIDGDPGFNNELSWLPGQRLSACTCPEESHPGPMRTDGSYVGRAAPEIDVFEATILDGIGRVSLSSQWAPFNAQYRWNDSTSNYIIYDREVTVLNLYIGGAVQQTTSALAITNQNCYELAKGCFAIFGFEYKTGFDNGYLTWVNNGKLAWTVLPASVGPDPLAEIGQRLMPSEPMYIIANLGFSLKFGGIDFENIQLPTVMSIDYIRVYQHKGHRNIGCDPQDHPTAAYIAAYQEAYMNPNLTYWKDTNQPWPKNRMTTGSC